MVGNRQRRMLRIFEVRIFLRDVLRVDTVLGLNLSLNKKKLSTIKWVVCLVTRVARF
jgi:hypothetical protein